MWRAPLVQPTRVLSRLEATLSPDERARAARLHGEHRRAAFIASRGAQRDILARYTGCAAARIAFHYADGGKPSLAENPRDVRFNVSNAGDLALVAVTIGADIGIDLEPLRAMADALRVARRFFAQPEIEMLSSLDEADRTAGFLRCWTRKEAYVKAVGGGLALPLDAFAVSLRPDEPAKLLETRPDPDEAGRWGMAALDAGAGYIAALVVAGGIGAVHCWDWESDG